MTLVREPLKNGALFANRLEAHPPRVYHLDRGILPRLGVVGGKSRPVASLPVLLVLVDGEALEHLLVIFGRLGRPEPLAHGVGPRGQHATQ